MNKGLIYGLGAYLLWGFMPIYWKLLHHVPALETLAHRTVWSLVFVAAILTLRRQWQWLRHTLRDYRTLGLFLLIAVLLAFNWGVYIWAVNAGFIVETSLGYFINPLVNVVLGVLFLQERMRPAQWIAIGLAATGVIYLTVSYGSLPWVALSLAFSFAFYGLLKKKVSLRPMDGLFLETAMLALPALIFLLYLGSTGVGALGHSDGWTTFLLPFTGIATALPLLLFAIAAKSVTLSTLGVLQYLAPTIQFMLGVFVYHEPFSPDRLIGFSFIWMALIVYTLEGIARRRRARRLQYGLT